MITIVESYKLSIETKLVEKRIKLFGITIYKVIRVVE